MSGHVYACALALAVLLVAPPALAQRTGGELVFPVAAEPGSYDAHQEDDADLIYQVAPFYNTLLRAAPGDRGGTKPQPALAESWSVSRDGRTYTFRIRSGVRFHDGSLLSARDVKASFDKIVFPPEGLRSPRKAHYADVVAIESPDASTVVFRLREPSSSFITRMMSPYNFIYRADLLAEDPRWYERRIMGTGPFTLDEHAPGSHVRGTRNTDYWDTGKPYLDGFRAVLIPRHAARVAAVRAGRVHVHFGGVTPGERDILREALGDTLAVQESPWNCALLVSINHERRPFDDRRVRRALTLGLDRHLGSQWLSRVAIVKSVAGLLTPGSPFATPPDALRALAGYGSDIRKARAQARRLLDEASVPEDFSFTFTNRGVPMPNEPLGVWLVDQWRRLGLKVELEVVEARRYDDRLRAGTYEVAMDLHCGDLVEPGLDLRKFLSTERSPGNFARYSDHILDSLYDLQEREGEAVRRRQIIREFERRLLDEEAHYLVTLQWQRIVPHVSTLKGWTITPSPTLNQTLDTVWLEQ